MSNSDSKQISSSSFATPFNRRDNSSDDSFTFSPPAHDDFFYIKYPTPMKKKNSQSNFETIAENFASGGSGAAFKNHLDPCKKYFNTNDTVVKGQLKSNGTDDGFKDAVCGTKLLKVAEKMMTNREFVKADIDDVEDEPFPLSKFNDKEFDNYKKAHGGRRGSRSLPASPKFERKSIVNPYFAVTKPENSNNKEISFLTNLFGLTASKDITASQLSLRNDDEIALDPSKFSSNTNLNFAEQSKESSGLFGAQPKPSELREMNFWSPTSM